MTGDKNRDDEDEVGDERPFWSGLWEDFYISIYQSRMFLLFWIIVVVPVLSYYIAIGQYHSTEVTHTPRHSWETLKYVRPLLSTNEKSRILTNTLYGETSFAMPDDGDLIKVRFFQSVNKHGNFQPPELFYEGVVFRIGVENSHDIDYARLDMSPEDISKHLHHRLTTELQPVPTAVMASTSTNNKTGWEEFGYAVYYSYEDLKLQGKLSSDTLQPWKRVLEPILAVARDFKQVYTTVWYPHTFGTNEHHKIKTPKKSPYQSPSKRMARLKKSRASPRRVASVISAANGDLGEIYWADSDIEIPKGWVEGEKGFVRRSEDTPPPLHVFQSIIQHTIPTHTGLNEISSTCAVWLSSVNHMEIETVNNVYQEGGGSGEYY